jgi:hypothetical protein
MFISNNRLSFVCTMVCEERLEARVLVPIFMPNGHLGTITQATVPASSSACCVPSVWAVRLGGETSIVADRLIGRWLQHRCGTTACDDCGDNNKCRKENFHDWLLVGMKVQLIDSFVVPLKLTLLLFNVVPLRWKKRISQHVTSVVGRWRLTML